MRPIICDRCEVKLDEHHTGHWLSFSLHIKGNTYADCDICPECAQELQEWIFGNKIENC